MGVSEIGFPQNVVYRTRIQTSDTLPVTIGASKYCEFLFDIDAGDRMTPLGIVGWGCNDKTQVFLLDFYMDNDLQTAKLILKNPYATTIAITSLYIDVIYSKQALDMSEVDVVDNLTTDSAVAALSARQGKLLNEKIEADWVQYNDVVTMDSGYALYGIDNYVYEKNGVMWLLLSITKSDQSAFAQTRHTVGTLKPDYCPQSGCNSVCGASNGINSFLNRNANVIVTRNGQIIVDCFGSNDVKQISVIIMYAKKGL